MTQRPFVNVNDLELTLQTPQKPDAGFEARIAPIAAPLGAMGLALSHMQRQAIRNDPRHHGKAVFYLGLCFKTRNNWRLAQRNFEEALQHLSNDDAFLRKEAMYLLAVGYAETGELDRAIDLGCELANLDFNYKNIGTLLEDWQAKPAK